MIIVIIKIKNQVVVLAFGVWQDKNNLQVEILEGVLATHHKHVGFQKEIPTSVYLILGSWLQAVC